MGRKKLLVVTLLLAFLLVPLAFSSGLLKWSALPLLSSPSTTTSSSSATVFVEPAAVIEDYLILPVDSKFTVHVNVSSVADLYSWQINMTWDPSVLNVSSIIAGEFLLRTISTSKTASHQLGFVINATDDVFGSSVMGESVLEDVSGISGSGRLVSVEFLVVGYGWSDLTISIVGTLPTEMLDSTGAGVEFTKTDGYFRNRLQGDANGDRSVDVSDMLLVVYHRSGPPAGPGGYDKNVDLNYDDSIDVSDMLIVVANRGRSV